MHKMQMRKRTNNGFILLVKVMYANNICILKMKCVIFFPLATTVPIVQRNAFTPPIEITASLDAGFEIKPFIFLVDVCQGLESIQIIKN